MRARPATLAVIAAGGALGTGARHGIARLAPAGPGEFPWATLAVNAAGSLALGFLLVLLLERAPPGRHLRPFLATGLLGAFTTYSTFAVEADLLARDGYARTALLYVAVTLAAGFAALWAGTALARALPAGRRDP